MFLPRNFSARNRAISACADIEGRRIENGREDEDELGNGTDGAGSARINRLCGLRIRGAAHGRVRSTAFTRLPGTA